MMAIMGKFCKCKDKSNVSTQNDMWGYWLICNSCEKKIEDSFVYYSQEGIDE